MFREGIAEGSVVLRAHFVLHKTLAGVRGCAPGNVSFNGLGESRSITVHIHDLVVLLIHC